MLNIIDTEHQELNRKYLPTVKILLKPISKVWTYETGANCKWESTVFNRCQQVPSGICSLQRIIPWYLLNRFEHMEQEVTVNENQEFSMDINRYQQEPVHFKGLPFCNLPVEQVWTKGQGSNCKWEAKMDVNRYQQEYVHLKGLSLDTCWTRLNIWNRG